MHSLIQGQKTRKSRTKHTMYQRAITKALLHSVSSREGASNQKMWVPGHFEVESRNFAACDQKGKLITPRRAILLYSFH